MVANNYSNDTGHHQIFAALQEAPDVPSLASVILAHLVGTLLRVVRWGLIALVTVGGAGWGCRAWPLIKKAPMVEAVQQVAP